MREDFVVVNFCCCKLQIDWPHTPLLKIISKMINIINNKKDYYLWQILFIFRREMKYNKTELREKKKIHQIEIFIQTKKLLKNCNIEK